MKNKRFLIAILTAVILISGCSKFFDINEDPNNPASAKTDFLLTGVETDLSDVYTIGQRLDGVLAVYVQQISSREAIDKYGVNGETFELTNSWYSLYRALANIDILIKQATEEDNLQYAGVAKLIKAFLFAQAVDVWGDIPYTEADQFDDGIQAPKYDKGSTVYPLLLDLIDSGIADLQNEESLNLLKMGDNDLIYGGDMDKWIRMGNTLKLKMYLNMREYTDVSTEVNKLITDDNLIESGGDFNFRFTSSSSPDERHPLFVSEYAGSQTGFYINPWFYETLKGENTYVFNGITDPRIPYYFCNQITAVDDTENPPEYRDGGFVSIYFGSDGVNRDHAGRSTFTMVGNFICGGAYDFGTGGELDANSSTGAAPYRMITYADRLYMQAELALAGVTSQDARDFLEQAMNASFNQVDDELIYSGEYDAGAPLIAGTIPADGYINAVLTEYDNGDADHKMEVLMSEKWASTFGKGIDQYSDYRRTGYPVLWDPDTMVADGGPDGSGLVPVSSGKSQPLSFPWSLSELNLNPNAPAQKTGTERVFWDVN